MYTIKGLINVIKGKNIIKQQVIEYQGKYYKKEIYNNKDIKYFLFDIDNYSNVLEIDYDFALTIGFSSNCVV